MVKFVKSNLLGSTAEFRDRFLDPIDKGKSADATDRAVIDMKQQSHLLHKLLRGTLLYFYSMEVFFLISFSWPNPFSILASQVGIRPVSQVVRTAGPAV